MDNEERALRVAEQATDQAMQMLADLKRFRADTTRQANWLWCGVITCAALAVLSIVT